jgi:hypothetical protein
MLLKLSIGLLIGISVIYVIDRIYFDSNGIQWSNEKIRSDVGHVHVNSRVHGDASENVAYDDVSRSLQENPEKKIQENK